MVVGRLWPRKKERKRDGWMDGGQNSRNFLRRNGKRRMEGNRPGSNMYKNFIVTASFT